MNKIYILDHWELDVPILYIADENILIEMMRRQIMKKAKTVAKKKTAVKKIVKQGTKATAKKAVLKKK